MFFEIFGVGRFFLHIPSVADSPTRSLNVVQKWLENTYIFGSSHGGSHGSGNATPERNSYRIF